jgi:EAL domain-containing protein (putative c-di-GMP-specific phosphodiesterase class I)
MAVAHPPETLALAEVLLDRGVRAVYQPIVRLSDAQVVGYEALARGPEGSAFERPDRLFAEARACDLVAELDWACRAAAVAGARAGGLRSPSALFVNIEPETSGIEPANRETMRVWESARDELRVVLEITERALTRRPAELLREIARARERGWGIALDDVGADPRSLALMPFVHPDVIKLDLRLVQQQPTLEIAKIVNAVRAEAERSGAAILAEGIETPAHVEAAQAVGATLGQGYFFGRPGPLDLAASAAGIGLADLSVPAPPGTPFELIGRVATPRVSKKRLLIEMSKQLEIEALEIGETAIVTASFQQASFFTSATSDRYEKLGRGTALVVALAEGIAREPAPLVRGVALEPTDPLRGEWTIAVVAPHFAACLSARDLGDNGPQMDRRFDYVLTFDRALAVAATEAMLTRVTTTDA